MHFRKTDMGTPLTGSSVASTYSSLLKTTDSTTFSATLKTICDGAGNNSSFQLASGAAAFLGTLDITGNTTLAGNFTVATNKFIVAAATGNTTVAGTLGVAGATTLSSTLAVTGAATLSSTLAVSSNISTSGGNLTVYGNITQSNAGSSSSIAGALTVGGATIFNGGVTFNSTTSFSSSISVAGITNSGTLVSTGAATIGTVGGASLGSTTLTSATISGFLTVAGPSTFNGNNTLGDASGDTVTINAGTVTSPNIATKTSPTASDLVLLRDAADSNRWKWGSVLNVVRGFSYNETAYRDNYTLTANSDRFIRSSAGTDWSVTHTFATVGNTATIEADICLGSNMATGVVAGIVEVATGNTVGMAATAIYNGDNGTNVRITGRFTSTAASHSFKIRLRCNSGGGGSSFSVNPLASEITFTPAPAWWAPKSSITVTETA